MGLIPASSYHMSIGPKAITVELPTNLYISVWMSEDL